MGIKIGEKPEGSFTNPLGLLNDCHRRIERFLNMMVSVNREAQGAELNEVQRKALETSLRYFREAAPKHKQDEEESLFPRLWKTQNPRAKAAQGKLDQLKNDHAVADKDHREVEIMIDQWLEKGHLFPKTSKRLAEALDRLSQLYQRHIRMEEDEVFPLAKKVLENSEIEAVGREMAERRGISPERPMRG